MTTATTGNLSAAQHYLRDDALTVLEAVYSGDPLPPDRGDTLLELLSDRTQRLTDVFESEHGTTPQGEARRAATVRLVQVLADAARNAVALMESERSDRSTTATDITRSISEAASLLRICA